MFPRSQGKCYIILWILDRNRKKVVRENSVKTFYWHFKKKKYRRAYMHTTLSFSEFQPVGHGYLNCLLSCTWIVSPDLGLPTQV